MNSNKTIEKYKKFILLVFMFFPVLAISLNFDNDIWFLLNHGKYLVTSGFPKFEPFTIHSGMQFIMQQWLFDLIIWLLYSYFGKFGVISFVFCVAIVITVLLYRLCMLLSNNQTYLSIIITAISSLIISMWFIVTRPQVLTYLLIITEILVLEKFMQQKKAKNLFVLTILSILQINIHSSMWMMIFVFLAPYIAEELLYSIKEKKIRRTLSHLLIVSAIMAISGFINPYGIEAMSYIFNSYGNNIISLAVSEMAVPDIKAFTGFVFYLLVIAICFIYILNKQGKTRFRYILLTLGTTILTLMNIKSIPYFVIGSVIPLAYFLKNKASSITFSNSNKKKDRNLIVILVVFLILIFITCIFAISAEYDEKNDYPPLKDAIDSLANSENRENIVLYTDYYNGGYAEYVGIKCYIDARAEVFLETINKKENIFNEFIELQNGKLHYKDFLQKYNFTHLLVGSDDTLEVFLSQDPKYYPIYKNDKGKIYIPLEKQE